MSSKGKSTKPKAFASLEPALHPLLLRALSSLQFAVPTPIQATLIPLALESARDILARARTGSGKTLAYAIPIVQGILQRRDQGQLEGTRALVLVPTRELAEQVRGQIGRLVEGLGLGDSEGDRIRVVNVVGEQGTRKKRKTTGGERVERYVMLSVLTVYGRRPLIMCCTGLSALQNAVGGPTRNRDCDSVSRSRSPEVRGELRFERRSTSVGWTD